MSKYLVAMLAYLDEDVRKRETKTAASYENFDDYVAEAGWQDWMEDFTEAPDGEECSETELKIIYEMQELIWKEAH